LLSTGSGILLDILTTIGSTIPCFFPVVPRQARQQEPKVTCSVRCNVGRETLDPQSHNLQRYSTVQCCAYSTTTSKTNQQCRRCSYTVPTIHLSPSYIPYFHFHSITLIVCPLRQLSQTKFHQGLNRSTRRGVAKSNQLNTIKRSRSSIHHAVWTRREQDDTEEAGVTVRPPKHSGDFLQQRMRGALLHRIGRISLAKDPTRMNALLMEFNSGDGACGKTSLLNVFTRGYGSQGEVIYLLWGKYLTT
jgi:hypothetical protein